jgi:hypothetical protein
MSAIIVSGPTVALTATATSSGSSITPANASQSPAGGDGPSYLRVVNTSATEPVFFRTGTTAPTAVIPVTATNTGSTCIAPGATEYFKVGTAGQPTVEIFFAVVAASSTAVYVTPVALIG